MAAMKIEPISENMNYRLGFVTILRELFFELESVGSQGHCRRAVMSWIIKLPAFAG